MVTWEDIVDNIPQKRGETVHVHHCKMGRNNDRLYITRCEDGYTILAHCFHCGQSRRFSSLKQAGKLAVAERRGTTPETGATVESPDDDERRSNRPRSKANLYRAFDEATFEIEDMPEHCLGWFRSAGIYDEEIEYFKLGYHRHSDRAVLPLFDEYGDLEVYQLRRLKDDGSPKYLTVKPKGRSHQCCIGTWRTGDNWVVIVEDVLSAIKVDRVFPAFPMLGTSLDAGQIDYITRQATEVSVWTDFDNPMVRKSTFKLVKQLGLFVPTYLVTTEKDPKYYTTEEIVDYVSRT